MTEPGSKWTNWEEIQSGPYTNNGDAVTQRLLEEGTAAVADMVRAINPVRQEPLLLSGSSGCVPHPAGQLLSYDSMVGWTAGAAGRQLLATRGEKERLYGGGGVALAAEAKERTARHRKGRAAGHAVQRIHLWHAGSVSPPLPAPQLLLLTVLLLPCILRRYFCQTGRGHSCSTA